MVDMEWKVDYGPDGRIEYGGALVTGGGRVYRAWIDFARSMRPGEPWGIGGGFPTSRWGEAPDFDVMAWCLGTYFSSDPSIRATWTGGEGMQALLRQVMPETPKGAVR